jgi:hypothetical protein
MNARLLYSNSALLQGEVRASPAHRMGGGRRLLGVGRVAHLCMRKGEMGSSHHDGKQRTPKGVSRKLKMNKLKTICGPIESTN